LPFVGSTNQLGITVTRFQLPILLDRFRLSAGCFGWTARPKIASAFSKSSGEPKGRPITLFVSKVSAPRSARAKASSCPLAAP
jgi:hypothetical protein